LVVLSPLSRASETGKAYLKRHPELADVTETWDSSHEMAFGDWDNKMVRFIKCIKPMFLEVPNSHGLAFASLLIVTAFFLKYLL